MRTDKESQLNLLAQFLFSLPLLLFAFIIFYSAFFKDQTEPISMFISGSIIGLFFLLWGSSWFLQLFGLNNSMVIAKITSSIHFKKAIKILMWIVIVFLVIFLLIGAFNVVAGLSATTIIIILLVLILFK